MSNNPSNRHDQKWMRNFKFLLKFAKRGGHARPWNTHVENGFNLGQWVAKQRSAKERMPLSRRKSLESTPGWSWTPKKDAWNHAFGILKKYVRREGHARVKFSHIENGFKLGQWMTVQRRKRAKKINNVDKTWACLCLWCAIQPSLH